MEPGSNHHVLFGALAMICLPTGTWAAQDRPPTIAAAPGTLVRWGAPGTTRCAMKGRVWAALQETCYYPIDLEQPPGRIYVSRSGAGRNHFAVIVVERFDYGTEEITLPDIPQANPSPADWKRDAS